MLVVLFASILAGVIPTLVYVGLLWWLDRYKKLPKWLLCTCFLWGAIPAAIISLIAEIILNIPVDAVLGSAASEVVGSSAIAPFVEESAKALSLIFLILLFRRYLDDALDGLTFGAMSGLGFAMTEDILYFVGAYSSGGASAWSITVIMRTVIFGLNHAFFTSITGAALGHARLAKDWTTRLLLPFLGLAGAMTFHAIHNFAASFVSLTCWSLLVALFSDWIGIMTIAVLIGFIWRRERRWILEELNEEIVQGGLTPDEYYAAASSWRRTKARWAALFSSGLDAYLSLGRLYQALTELAFKKHQLRALGEESETTLQISRLRARIAKLRGELGFSKVSAPYILPTAEVEASPTEAELILTEISGLGRRLTVTSDRFSIGRRSGDLTIDNPEVSRRHAEIWRAGHGFRVLDLGSTNGTRVNGKLVKEALLIQGDSVSFGPAAFTVQMKQVPVNLSAKLGRARVAVSSQGFVPACLVFANGRQAGQQLPVNRQAMFVGRQKSDLVIDDSYVSRRHAEIWRAGDQYYVADLKSKNGSFLNGQRIDTPQPLHDGDQLRFGDTILSFQLVAA